MLPRFGFGGAPLGNLMHRVPDPDAHDTLDAAWTSGIRFFDTSPWYGRGLSEHRLGSYLYIQPREEFVLSTKVGRLFRSPRDRAAFERTDRAWSAGFSFEHYSDYTYDGVMRSYEDSLQRLGMNRIDLLLIHDLDLGHFGSERLLNAHLADLTTGGIRALNELKTSGEIRAIGAGINHVGAIPDFLEVIDLDFFLVATPYTLADQPALELELPLCEERGIGLIIGAVFASGILATGPVPGARFNYREPTPEEVRRIEQIEAVCRRYDVPLPAAALQFPLHHPLVASIIPGAFHPDQIRENLRHIRHPIPDSFWHELKGASLIHAEAPTP
ncbi:MAG: aldo/keto reductase [Acidimicrobiales bacterium]